MGHLVSSAAVRHPLEYSVNESTISLSGDLDLASVCGLRAAFENVAAAETIDMSGVRMLTSAALIEFLTLAHRAGPRKIVLLNAPPTIVRLFHVLGLERLFLLSDCYDASVVKIAPRRPAARKRSP
jgi:anti-anti-sigma regulatory factor